MIVGRSLAIRPSRSARSARYEHGSWGGVTVTSRTKCGRGFLYPRVTTRSYHRRVLTRSHCSCPNNSSQCDNVMSPHKYNTYNPTTTARFRHELLPCVAILRLKFVKRLSDCLDGEKT